MNRILGWLTIVLVVMAIACSIGLLTGDTKIGILRGFAAPTISAAPLLLIGACFLVVQAMRRPRPTELLKNVLLAAAFLLWGIVQLMEQNALSKRLGNVVIALYVLDLAWGILEGMNRTG
jgi:peptidoglycan/LPS O-acetylase OafA/YrhL